MTEWLRAIEWLSMEQVIIIHDELLERWGGEQGTGHRGDTDGAEAAVQAVKNSYYESIEELGAAYAVYIIQGHVFLDGNKRTGAAAMFTFLQRNQRSVRLSAEDIFDLMVELQERAEAGERTDRLVYWLAGSLP